MSEVQKPERFRRTKQVVALAAASLALAACNNTTPTEVVATPSSVAASANPSPEQTSPSPKAEQQESSVISVERGKITVDATNQASNILKVIDSPNMGVEHKDPHTLGGGSGSTELLAGFYEAGTSVTGHDNPTLFIRAIQSGENLSEGQESGGAPEKAIEYQFSLKDGSPMHTAAQAATENDPLDSQDFQAALSDPSSIELDYIRVSENNEWTDLSFNPDNTRAVIESSDGSQETYMRGDNGFAEPVLAFASHAEQVVEQIRQAS